MGENVYQCSAGETFDSVALVLYGDERYARELMAANPECLDHTVFRGGERLCVPAVDRTDGGALAYAPSTAPWRG